MKKIRIIAVLLLVINFMSYYIFPSELRTEGGSCNQGIAMLFDRIILIICGLINITSILTFKLKNDLSLKLGMISTLIWFFWCLAIIIDSFYQFLFLLPLLSISIINLIFMIKEKKLLNTTQETNITG